MKETYFIQTVIVWNEFCNCFRRSFQKSLLLQIFHSLQWTFVESKIGNTLNIRISCQQSYIIYSFRSEFKTWYYKWMKTFKRMVNLLMPSSTNSFLCFWTMICSGLSDALGIELVVEFSEFWLPPCEFSSNFDGLLSVLSDIRFSTKNY